MSDEATRAWLREEVLPRLKRAGVILVPLPDGKALEWLRREAQLGYGRPAEVREWLMEAGVTPLCSAFTGSVCGGFHCERDEAHQGEHTATCRQLAFHGLGSGQREVDGQFHSTARRFAWPWPTPQAAFAQLARIVPDPQEH